MKITQIKVEYDSYQEFMDDTQKKYSESFSESTVTARKEGKIIVLWKNESK